MMQFCGDYLASLGETDSDTAHQTELRTFRKPISHWYLQVRTMFYADSAAIRAPAVRRISGPYVASLQCGSTNQRRLIFHPPH
jgi:hypothetical protein